MAEGEQDRSENATPFKLQKAREKGSVAKGTDLGFLTSMAAFLGYLWIAGPGIGRSIAEAWRKAIIGGTGLAEGPWVALSVAPALFSAVLLPLLAMLGTIFAVVLLFEILQTGVVFSAEPLKLDFTRLNPATGLKRLLTVRLLIETAKNVLKMGCYGVAGYLVISHVLVSDIASVHDGSGLSALLFRSGLRLLAAFVAVALFFAVIDQLIVRRAFSRKMAMSRREVRRETRDREGDPRLKQRRKQLHAEFSKLSQSLRNLKGADVVITNPEHIALALRYDRKTMQAPRIVSMGINRFAQHLKRMAMLYGIPVIENRPLARAMYSRTALNQQIPDGCFQAVAGIYNTLRAAANARNGER
jgi:flagellar biosynthetic protein FlhB